MADQICTTEINELGGTTQVIARALMTRLGDVNGDGKLDLLALGEGVSMTGPPPLPNGQTGFPQLGYLPGDGLGGFGTFTAIAAVSDPNLCGTTYCQNGQICSNNMCVQDCRFGGMCQPMGSGSCNQNTGLCSCGTGPACTGGQYCVNGAWISATTPPRPASPPAWVAHRSAWASSVTARITCASRGVARRLLVQPALAARAARGSAQLPGNRVARIGVLLAQASEPGRRSHLVAATEDW